MSSKSKTRSLVQWAVFAGLVVAGVLLWNNRQTLSDDVNLWNYTPPAAVASLALKIDFTPEGQRYFYASHPSIDTKTTFNQACGSTEASGTVLGCYTNRRIYVYDVTDARLDGVQEVTAAHEMLHAAYARLSDSERTHVNAMVQREYDSLKTNADFAARFSVYNSLSQADKLNELHSIFGTEVASLSGELETYYKQYFKDRSITTADYASYQGQFTSLQTKQTTLKAQIETLKTQINAGQAQYQTARDALDSDIQSFNQKASGGGYTSQATFNADRNALVTRSNDLNQTAATINAQIDQYNADIQEYNALAIQTQDLQNSLDSNSVQAAPSV